MRIRQAVVLEPYKVGVREVDLPAIDAYLATSPSSVRRLLAKVRATIRKAAPAAEEKISYGIPTFFLHGNLVRFECSRLNGNSGPR